MKKLYYTLIMLMLTACGNKAENTQYLVPQGFEGRVNIFFNMPQGAACKYENGKRVLHIQPNGCCLTQCKPNYGVFTEEFYTVDAAGKKTLIAGNDSIKTYSIGTGTIQHQGSEVHFYAFIVCPPHKYKQLLEQELNTGCLVP